VSVSKDVQRACSYFSIAELASVRLAALTHHCYALLLLQQAVWMLWRIALPLYYFDISVAQFTALFLISEWMTGYYLAFNFQVRLLSYIYTEYTCVIHIFYWCEALHSMKSAHSCMHVSATSCIYT
jgi:hypothetical protein